MQSVSIMRGIDRLIRKNSVCGFVTFNICQRNVSYLDHSSPWKDSNQVSNDILLITFLFFSFHRFLTIIH